MSAAPAASKRFAERNLAADGLRLAAVVPCGVPGRPRRAGGGDIVGFLNAYLTQLATGELKK